jgi:hypothetical protein
MIDWTWRRLMKTKDPTYFKARGVKWGIARRFVKDIRYWAENYNKCVTSEADI